MAALVILVSLLVMGTTAPRDKPSCRRQIVHMCVRPDASSVRVGVRLGCQIVRTSHKGCAPTCAVLQFAHVVLGSGFGCQLPRLYVPVCMCQLPVMCGSISSSPTR